MTLKEKETVEKEYLQRMREEEEWEYNQYWYNHKWSPEESFEIEHLNRKVQTINENLQTQESVVNNNSEQLVEQRVDQPISDLVWMKQVRKYFKKVQQLTRAKELIQMQQLPKAMELIQVHRINKKRYKEEKGKLQRLKKT